MAPKASKKGRGHKKASKVELAGPRIDLTNASEAQSAEYEVGIRSTAGKHSVQTFIDIQPKKDPCVVEWMLQFKTTVTSAKRIQETGQTQEFYGITQITLDLGGVTVVKEARSNNFELLSRPPEKKTATLQLEEVATDGHPGELVTCMPHPQCEVQAELGQGDSVLHKIASARDSKVAFVTRLPEDLPLGEYWLRLVSSHPSTEPSHRYFIHVAPKPAIQRSPKPAPQHSPMRHALQPALQPIQPMMLPPAELPTCNAGADSVMGGSGCRPAGLHCGLHYIHGSDVSNSTVGSEFACMEISPRSARSSGSSKGELLLESIAIPEGAKKAGTATVSKFMHGHDQTRELCLTRQPSLGSIDIDEEISAMMVFDFTYTPCSPEHPPASQSDEAWASTLQRVGSFSNISLTQLTRDSSASSIRPMFAAEACQEGVQLRREGSASSIGVAA